MGEAVGHDLLEGLRGLLVAQVPVATRDPLFERPGTVRVVHQEAVLVVGLQHEGIGLASLVRDERGHVAEVGCEDDRPGCRAHEEAHGVGRVVGYGEGLHVEVTQREALPGAEEAPVEFRDGSAPVAQGLHGCPLGLPVCVNGQFVARGKNTQGRNVVVVLVGKQDPVEVGRHAAHGRESLFDSQGTQAGVHEEAGAGALKECAVPLAPTGKDGQTNGHPYYAK